MENIIEIDGKSYMEIPNVNDGNLSVIVSKDKGRMHLSISHGRRPPTWSEIKEARYGYLPQVKYAAIILPPKEEYVDVHPFCFHVWEIAE